MNFLLEKSKFNNSLCRTLNFFNNQAIVWDDNPLFNVFAAYRPDVFISYTHSVEPFWFRLFAKYPETQCLLIAEQEGKTEIVNDLANRFKVKIITHTNKNYEKLETIHLPYGADLLLYKPGKLNKHLACDLVCDNPGVAHGDYVYECLREEHNLNVKLFGDAAGHYMALPQYLGFLTDEQLCDAYTSALACLAVNINDDVLDHTFYNIFACGGICVYPLKTNVVCDSQYAFGFNSKNDLVQLLKELKKGEYDLGSYRNKALEFARENSYFERTKQLLAQL